MIDEYVSWRVAELLTEFGHDAAHVRDLDAGASPSWAASDGRPTCDEPHRRASKPL